MLFGKITQSQYILGELNWFRNETHNIMTKKKGKPEKDNKYKTSDRKLKTQNQSNKKLGNTLWLDIQISIRMKMCLPCTSI